MLHIKRRLTVVVTLLAGLILSFEGYTATSAQLPTEFRIAVGVDPDTLDPWQLTTTTASNIVDYMVETLVTISQEGEIVPLLAESWEVSEDGLEVTFHLRNNVVFHDGTPLEAELIKWNLDRLIDTNLTEFGWLPTPYSSIDGVEAIDPLIVTFNLNTPSATALIAELTTTTTAILSPSSVGQFGNEFDNIQHPIGTGPYIFEEHAEGERIAVTKFDDYWGQEPFFDQVIFLVVPEAASREALLLAGDVDMIVLPPMEDLATLQENPDLDVLLASSDRTIFVALPNQQPPFDDVRVRQALNYAVDKSAIIENVLFGAADVMDAPMAPSLAGYCATGTYEYDPDRARELLAEAGVAPGTELELLTPNGRYLQDVQATQAIAGFLSEIGFDVTVQVFDDWPTYINSLFQLSEESNLRPHLFGWAPDVLDAAWQMQQFSSQHWPPYGAATSFYENPEVERIIETASGEVNSERREELYCEASEIIWEDAPWIFLWVQRFPIVHSASVNNISTLPNEKFYAIYARPA